MNKTKWILLAALMLVLSACGFAEKEESKPQKESDESTEVVTEDQEEKEVIETVAPVEEKKPEILYELNPANWTFKPVGDANPKVVLLTIDDAPEKYAVEMAKTLKELNAPAIFFVNGHFIETDEGKANLKEIYDMGFAIGNHTQTHANLKNSSEDQQKEEILKVSETVQSVIGEKPKFFRAPYGVNTDFSKSLVQSEKMLLMNWTYGYDWEKKYMDSANLADIMVNTEYLTNGANLLMHDRKWTAEALADIVKGLRAKGYDFIDPQTIKGIEQ
ncbi:polysaccharide deacetylase family protein [Psychrobacillus vulpis]|uniref:Polysaccharide deacetylase family protein n=1 Tax=Psychrobacillus vulpis TaxID=2325572 RepID=A0A544TRR7_9BACI|nr:polysaccharide deacetylase family protein [Psychrobacillus vulpis]TQR20141.1 polysaccharide deacetylase family protein [Psychrobacillus vulpis]